MCIKQLFYVRGLGKELVFYVGQDSALRSL